MGNNTPTLNVFPRRDTHHFYSQPIGWNQSPCSTQNSWRGRNTQSLLCPRRGGNWKYQWALVKSTSKYIVLFQFETRAIESSLNLKDLKIWDKSVIHGLACLAPCSMDMVGVKVQYLPRDTIQIELGMALCFSAQTFLATIIPLMLSYFYQRKILGYHIPLLPQSQISFTQRMFSDYKKQHAESRSPLSQYFHVL